MNKAGPDRGDGPCWLWTAGKLRGGYGYFFNPTDICAHRYSYRLIHGPITPGLYVLHRCDTKACIRPDHLFLGTQSDNMDDFRIKGHPGRVFQKGEKISASKLSENDVVDVRSLATFGASRATLAKAYGVSWTSIQAILHRSTWKHIP